MSGLNLSPQSYQYGFGRSGQHFPRLPLDAGAFQCINLGRGCSCPKGASSHFPFVMPPTVAFRLAFGEGFPGLTDLERHVVQWVFLGRSLTEFARQRGTHQSSASRAFDRACRKIAKRYPVGL
jgi:hypothetical protein